MTAPVVNDRTLRDPISAASLMTRALMEGDSLARPMLGRVDGQLWSRLAERAETHQ